jgi:hypothetical protein
MMRNKDGETPKELATAIVLTEIAALSKELPFNHRDEHPPSFERKVREQIAKIHNRMLDKSNLDGMHVEEVDPTPWCHACGAMEQENCDCLPIAENN